MAKQILTLYPDTFIWIRPAKGLLYNTKKFTIKEFETTRNVLLICSRLLENNPGRRIIIDTDNFFDDEKQFMDLLISNKFGYVSNSDENTYPEKPSRLRAMGGLQNGLKRNVRDLSRYFSDLTIYLGGECEQTEFYKQTFYPCYSASSLTAIEIIDFLNRVQTPYLKHIHIIVSDLYGKSNLSLLFSWLLQARELIIFYIPYLLAKNSFICDTLKNLGFSVKIISLGNQAGAREVKESVRLERKYTDMNLTGYHFLVKNNSEFDYYTQLSSGIGPGLARIIPVYYHNLKFIKEKIFRDRSFLQPDKLTKKEIRIRQTFNSNFFGNLTLMPDKYIYSNVNCPPLGDMREPLREIVYRELEYNYAWRMVRNMPPCCHCKYQWTCPSPSNYEFVIGKTDLCYENKSVTPGQCTCG